jgi:hypothetical protein
MMFVMYSHIEVLPETGYITDYWLTIGINNIFEKVTVSQSSRIILFLDNEILLPYSPESEIGPYAETNILVHPPPSTLLL